MKSLKCEVCKVNKQVAWFRLKEVCSPCFIKLKRKANISAIVNMRMDNAKARLCNCKNCIWKRENT